MRFFLPLFAGLGAALGSAGAAAMWDSPWLAALCGGIGAVVFAILALIPNDKASPAATPSQRQIKPSLAIWDNLPAPIVLVDQFSRIVRLNDAARGLFGDVSPEEPLVAAIRSPDLIDALEDLLSDGQPRDLSFTQMQGRSRRSLAARIRALDADPAYQDQQRAPAAVILIEDHTQMKQVESMRQDFITNASHELKTPLASIIGFIETLQGPAREDEAARHKFLGIMAKQADRMKRLVEDLLSLNRIEMNTHIAPTGRVDLGALAHEIAAALAPVAQSGEAQIAITAPTKGPMVVGDRDQLAQLLTNFVDNAIKYGGKGVQVTITMADDAPEWPGKVGLSVRDTGPGIPREHLPRLTERFYRVSATHSRSVGGTGLGLAIAKHIAQRHRGDIAVRSTLGEGSEFTLWLPRLPRSES